MHQNIKATLRNLSEVAVVTDDTTGDRYVTDRYTAWKMSHLPRKAYAALEFLPDGWYKLSASGAAAPCQSMSAVGDLGTGVARLVLAYVEGEPLERTTLTLDATGKARNRVYLAPTAGVVLIDDTYDLTTGGYLLRAHGSGDPRKSVGIYRGDDVAGIVMPARLLDESREILARIGDTFGRVPATT